MSVASEGLPVEAGRNSVVKVALVDHDPISRHVLRSALDWEGVTRLVTVTEDPEAVWQHASDEVDVVVFCTTLDDSAFGYVRVCADRGLRVLLVGTGWTKELVNAALAAGTWGCVVKSIKIDAVTSAAVAVGTGHLILSPELDHFYRLGAPDSARAATTARPGAALPLQRLVETLTERELEVLTLLAKGNNTAEVSAVLNISRATVKSHVSHSLTKLGARNRVEAVLMIRAATHL